VSLDYSSRRGQPALGGGESDEGEKDGKETHCSACNILSRTSALSHHSCQYHSQRRAMWREREQRVDEAKVGGGKLREPDALLADGTHELRGGLAAPVHALFDRFRHFEVSERRRKSDKGKSKGRFVR
jgi:hypothetical protein